MNYAITFWKTELCNYFLKILRREFANALSYTLLKPLWKSSSAMTKLKGLHKETAPERRQE